MEAGAVLGGRYRVDRIAGAGGMGTVYRAVDLRSGAPCAIKVIADGATERTRDRFLLEATILAKVSHPGIVRYLDHGASPPFLVMEWVDGESLADRVARSGITPAEALRLGERLVRALAAAHAAGVVHRDVKPRNVMLPGGAFEEAKIVDFGIARAHGVGARTSTGVRLGTPRYMAPEQIVSSRRVDGRADVFSLGCVLFEMLTGRKAFRGRDEVALLARMVIEDAPRVRSVRPDLPEDVDALVARMLVRDHRKRPFADDALAGELGALANRLVATRAVRSLSSESELTADETPRELTLATGLTPLPPPSELPWSTVGRDEERARLEAALTPGAVVGLWGALGIGKSHLSHDVARRAWQNRGALSCDLRGANDEADIVRCLASELGVLHAPSLEDVCAAIAARGGPLVVLDACDGALSVAARVAERVVAEATDASVLVVSRERPAAIETTIELGPLDGRGAVTLFVARSRGAADAARDREALEQIITALQGNPLALTLAASRTSVLGVAAVASRVERPLEVLGSAKTSAYPQSLRDALLGMWDALADAERRVAIACSIFPGAMRPEIAEPVCAAALDEGTSALDVLEGLRDKSLVRPGPRGTLVMDAGLRELARSKTDDLGARVAFAKAAFARETIERAPSDFGELLVCEADLLAATELAITAGDEELALAGVLALEPALSTRGPIARIAELLDRAIGIAHGSSVALARARAARGRVATLERRLELARRSFDEAIAGAREHGDVELEASTWLDRGVMHQAEDDFSAAERCYLTVLDVHDSAASRSEARARGNLGALAHDRGELDLAYAHYVRAIAVAESIGDSRLLGVFLSNLAVLDRERGSPSSARQRFFRALQAMEDAGDRRLVGIALGNLGMLELEQRRVGAALSAFERSAEILSALGDVYSAALAHARLGAALALSGDAPGAERAISKGERLAAHDDKALAVVRFFRVFPETARAKAGGDAASAFEERARSRVKAAAALAATVDDVRAALRVLEGWV